MPDGLRDELAEVIHGRIEQAISDNYRAPDGTHPVNPSAVATIATAAALAALAGHDTAGREPGADLAGLRRRAEQAERALAEAREEIEEDARVMRAWRRREAQAVARAEEAEAAIARVRDVHQVHRCTVDGHLLKRTPTPCDNNGFCSCRHRDPCPTTTALNTPENTP